MVAAAPVGIDGMAGVQVPLLHVRRAVLVPGKGKRERFLFLIFYALLFWHRDHKRKTTPVVRACLVLLADAWPANVIVCMSCPFSSPLYQDRPRIARTWKLGTRFSR